MAAEKEHAKTSAVVSNGKLDLSGIMMFTLTIFYLNDFTFFEVLLS